MHDRRSVYILIPGVCVYVSTLSLLEQNVCRVRQGNMTTDGNVSCRLTPRVGRQTSSSGLDDSRVHVSDQGAHYERNPHTLLPFRLPCCCLWSFCYVSSSRHVHRRCSDVLTVWCGVRVPTGFRGGLCRPSHAPCAPHAEFRPVKDVQLSSDRLLVA